MHANAIDEDEFRDAVKRIRERKDRERQESGETRKPPVQERSLNALTWLNR